MLTVVIKGREIVVPDEERQPCECWTRVMGYFRPVSDWNIGKKGEHAERLKFKIPDEVKDVSIPVV